MTRLKRLVGGGIAAIAIAPWLGGFVAHAASQPTPPSGDDRATSVSGNATSCADVGFPSDTQFGAQNSSGASSSGFAVTSDGQNLTVSSIPANTVIDVLIVKGGDAYNVYASAVFATLPQSGLHAPLVGTDQNVPTISHWFLCYGPASTTSGGGGDDGDGGGTTTGGGDDGDGGGTTTGGGDDGDGGGTTTGGGDDGNGGGTIPPVVIPGGGTVPPVVITPGGGTTPPVVTPPVVTNTGGGTGTGGGTATGAGQHSNGGTAVLGVKHVRQPHHSTQGVAVSAATAAKATLPFTGFNTRRAAVDGALLFGLGLMLCVVAGSQRRPAAQRRR